MTLTDPPETAHLMGTVGSTAVGAAWLSTLPARVARAVERWDLTLGAILMADATGAWVAHAKSEAFGSVVLKIGFPHMEALHEIAGLRCWNRIAMVGLVAADEPDNAMLLERCDPGTSLRSVAPEVQDEVIAGILQRLWAVAPSEVFRPLGVMVDHWCQGILERRVDWIDGELVEAGLDRLQELSSTAGNGVLLATDLHAGNVLSAGREPWLAIDPKPFVGDPAYDATQHLLNSLERVGQAPEATIGSFASRLRVDPQRVRDWLFARLAIATGSQGLRAQTLARQLRQIGPLRN